MIDFYHNEVSDNIIYYLPVILQSQMLMQLMLPSQELMTEQKV